MATSPTKTVGQLPSFDHLFSESSLFDGLSTDAQDALYEQVAVMEAKLKAKLLARGRNGWAPVPDPDRAVRIEEAAPLLGMTSDYLYRHWRKLGGYKDD